MPDIPGHPGVYIAESTSGVPTITVETLYDAKAHYGR